MSIVAKYIDFDFIILGTSNFNNFLDFYENIMINPIYDVSNIFKFEIITKKHLKLSHIVTKYIDKEILKIKQKELPTQIFFNNMNFKKFTFNGQVESSIFKSKTHKMITNEKSYYSEDKSMFMFSIDINWDQYSGMSLLGILDLASKECVCVGIHDSHPFIITDKFIYGCSDGSDFCWESIEGTNDKTLKKNIIKYYTIFINDDCH